MCDHSRRLVAWLDREVAADEAAEIERHVAACAECRNCAAELERASISFEEYGEALAQSKEGRNPIRVAPIWWAAAAAVLLAVLVYPRRHDPAWMQTLRTTEPVQTVSSKSVTAKAAQYVSTPLANHHHRARRRAAAPPGEDTVCCAPATMQNQNAKWVEDEPAIQIAIPAEAVFPPGAVPEGVHFVADVSIGVDGRVEQLRLLPRPVAMERRTDQP
jgi:hypothetical protein